MPNREMNDNGIGSHWFESLADHMGEAYLRYSFTKGTAQEVDYLVTALGLVPGMRVLDVGCGPGRHSYELARRGIIVHGIDISSTFIEIARANAPSGATFERIDARQLTFDGDFDAAVCLCQGAFGLMTADGDDRRVLEGIRAAVKPDGMLALTAFNAYFAVRYHDDATFDASAGVAHESTEIRDSQGRVESADLWTGCYTPRELRLLLASAGFAVRSISSVEPGAYRDGAATVESPEFLVIAFATPFRREGDPLAG